MIFNVTEYLLHVNKQAETYMIGVLKQLNERNPEWISSIKNDSEMFNEDGTPKELSEDKIQSKINEIVGKDFGVYQADEKEILSLFTITEEQVKQFIIEK